MVKPTHPPFSNWLLSGETLPAQQNIALQEHLRTCEGCRQLQTALSEVHYEFRMVGQVAPAAGFTDRWQLRLNRQRVKRQRRSAWFMFFSAASMALVILTLVGWQIAGVFDSPASILSSLVYVWTYGVVMAERMTDIFGITLRLLPSMTILGGIFFIGFCTLMSVLWLVTYRQLTNGRRVASW